VPRAVHALGHVSTTYDSELDAAAPELIGDDYVGTFSNDNQPRRAGKGQCWIYNRSMTYEPGTHWQAAFSTGSGIIRWDSYGRAGRMHPDSFVGSGDAEQHPDDKWCGQLCFAWLLCCREMGWHAARLL
jgi:hypothetical protein